MELLSRIFHEYYQAKIIEILLENHNEEFSISEVMRMADTAQGSTYNYMKFLNKEGLIEETRKIGNVQLYRLNKKNDYIKAFILFEHYLVTSKLDEKIKEKEKEISIKTYSDKSEFKKLIEFFSNDFNKYETKEAIFDENVKNSKSLMEESKKWKKMVTK